jgi:hypothetical protein
MPRLTTASALTLLVLSGCSSGINGADDSGSIESDSPFCVAARKFDSLARRLGTGEIPIGSDEATEALAAIDDANQAMADEGPTDIADAIRTMDEVDMTVDRPLSGSSYREASDTLNAYVLKTCGISFEIEQ